MRLIICLKNQLLAVIHKFKRAVSFNFLIERFSVFGRQSSSYFSEFSPYFHFRFGNNFRDMSQPNLQNVFACTNVLKKIFSWISESFLWISVIFVRSSVKPAESTSLPWPISIKSFLVKSLFFLSFFFFFLTRNITITIFHGINWCISVRSFFSLDALYLKFQCYCLGECFIVYVVCSKKYFLLNNYLQRSWKQNRD